MLLKICLHVCEMAILSTFKKKQPTELFCKKVVLKNFAIFT